VIGEDDDGEGLGAYTEYCLMDYIANRFKASIVE